MDDLADALAGQVGLDEQRCAVGEVEALAEKVHAGGPAVETAPGVVEPVGLDEVPEGGDGVLGGIGEPGADLEGNLDAAGRDGADEGACGDGGADHLTLDHGRGGDRGGGFIVDEAGHADERAALRGSQKVGLGGDAVLKVAELVGDGREGLHEHDAEVGFGALLPGGIALSGELREGEVEALEILGEIVDGRERRLRGGAAIVFRGAVEVGRAEDFEGEGRALIHGIERRAGEGESVSREVSRCADRDGKDRVAVGVDRPAGAALDGGDGDAGDAVASGDGGHDAGHVDIDGIQKVNVERGRVDGLKLDKVDAVDGGRGDHELETVARFCEDGGHISFTVPGSS